MRSAPQKQPMPTTSCSRPSGKGGSSGVPSTSWRDGTGILASRPGSASPGSGRRSFARVKSMMRGESTPPAIRYAGSARTTRTATLAGAGGVVDALRHAALVRAVHDVPLVRVAVGVDRVDGVADGPAAAARAAGHVAADAHRGRAGRRVVGRVGGLADPQLRAVERRPGGVAVVDEALVAA